MNDYAFLNDILIVCKYCKSYSYNKRIHNKHKCEKNNCSITDAHCCVKRLQYAKTSYETFIRLKEGA